MNQNSKSQDEAIAEEINQSKIKKKNKTDLSNCVAIDKGVLKLMFNILERQGKSHIVEEAKHVCFDISFDATKTNECKQNFVTDEQYERAVQVINKNTSWHLDSMIVAYIHNVVLKITNGLNNNER